MSTIIGLAQDFVGTNNINVLLPIGQFGTRLQGGSDAASARYIYTMLNPVTRTLFPKDDDYVLRFLYEENQRIEPEWYVNFSINIFLNAFFLFTMSVNGYFGILNSGDSFPNTTSLKYLFIGSLRLGYNKINKIKIN